jgi:OmcA/MtrC family decaheme c-type cytochrome
VNAAALTPDQWSQLSLKGSVTSVTMGGKPVVNFTVTDGNGTPVQGLGFTSQASTALAPGLANMAFSIAKLVPGTNGSPSKWVSYIVTTMPTTTKASAPSVPTTDSTGTLVDHGDGTYTYTFYRDITQAQAFLDAATYTGNNVRADLGDVSYQPALLHRIGIQVGGSARGTGRNTPDGSTSTTAAVNVKTPANILYDFYPATGQPAAANDPQDRRIVDMASCNTCHTKLSWHGGNRVDINFCVMCHNDQLKYGNPEATLSGTGYTGETRKIQGMSVGDMPAFVHRIHMGEHLTLTGYAFSDINPFDARYPQDLRNCTKCHTSSISTTTQGDNWMNVPSRLACGACHDSIDWASGTNHTGGPQLDDKNCTGCHGATGIQLVHTPTVAGNPAFATGGYTNGAAIADYRNNLPAGAINVTWDLQSVSLNASSQPVFVFRFLQNGQRADFNVFGSGKTELWDNFVGGPSVYLAFAVPQDGITTPADWNATVSTYVKKVWNGTATGTSAGTLSGPDTNGYYTLTMTGVTIPANASMLTGGIGFTYNKNNQPITQTNVPGFPYDTTTMLGGLSVPPPNVTKVATGSTARRAIVSSQKCNSCHAVLGVFTDAAYHAGERNTAENCTFCHNANYVGDHGTDGWADNEKDFIHALHAAPVRNNMFSWQAANGADYWNTTWPGAERSNMLNNCEICHVAGSYDFSNATNAAAVPNLLWSTAAAGATPTTTVTFVTGSETIPTGYTVVSPFVTPGVNYGAAFKYTASATGGTIAPAANTTLVNSPIASACFGCHDSATDIAHFQGNGGAIYEARTTALAKVEQCLICHGTGKIADIKAMHMNF